MKEKRRKIQSQAVLPLLGLTMFLALGAATAFAYRGHAGNVPGMGMGPDGMSSPVSQLPKEELSQVEKDGLLKMVEEEKLARDVYAFLYDKWKSNVFLRIGHAEQRHMDGVISLFDKYGLENPVESLGQGKFASPEMQALYDSLTAQGAQSLEQALQVGATVEDLDIKDLNELIGKCDNQDVLMVFQNLVKGSRNHLRAFTSYLESLGSSYTAQYLTQDEVDKIVASDWERGPVDSMGNPMRGLSGKEGCSCPCRNWNSQGNQNSQGNH